MITLSGVTKTFGSNRVLRGVDLTIPSGQSMVIIGGSGTGKSVLMRSIIGLQLPDAGTIEVLGSAITDARGDDDIDIRSRWGVLFQGGALFSTLTVGENVEVPLREFYPDFSKALLDEIAHYKIYLSGLPADAAHKFPSELSGGMRKRAGLARALAIDPELLFLDESASIVLALDHRHPYTYSTPPRLFRDSAQIEHSVADLTFEAQGVSHGV